MRSILLLAAGLMLAGSVQAQIGWSNIQWPTPGSNQPGGADITVYSQAWAPGCTDQPGPCELIHPYFYYRAEGAADFTETAMIFQGDAGSNDQYYGVLPAAALMGSRIDFYVMYADDVAEDFIYPDGYNADNPAHYNLVQTTSEDCIIAFELDMTCADEVIAPGFSGSFNGWTFTDMIQDAGLVYEGQFTIPAGSNPSQEFKFRNGEGWEDVSNRTFTIPTGEEYYYIGYYYWNDIEECSTTDADEMPSSFDLSQNHPNPFNPSTTINFSLEMTMDARLSVYDLQGHEVATLVNGTTTSGSHSVVFDAANLASGIYFYALTSDAGTLTKRMVLVK
jgi:hypothetical protein